MELANACRAAAELNEDFVQKRGNVDQTFQKSLKEETRPGTIETKTAAEEFVENLLTEGATIPCDETSDTFINSMKIPPFFDEEMFKKGQEFFDKHMFGLFFSKLLGLIALLAIPTSIRILVLTNMSSTEMTAYKRYMSTIFHMCLWYDQDFKPGSRSWTSIAKIRGLHNSASKRSCLSLKYRINQKDIALTQFGFMGFGLVRSRMMGVHNTTEEEWKSFIHLWRTIGHVLGIEDRFNICRESVKETKEICNLLIDKVFLPAFENPPEEFEKMSKALIKGMWVMNPILEEDVFLLFLQMTLDNKKYLKKRLKYQELNFSSKMKVQFIVYVMWSLQFSVLRVIFKYIQIMTLWLMAHFPFLAYYRYGMKNSQAPEIQS